jgi:hypothetical protein
LYLYKKESQKKMIRESRPAVNFCIGYRGQPNTLTTTPQLVTFSVDENILGAGTEPIGPGKEYWNTERSEFTVPDTGPYNIITNWILTSPSAAIVTVIASLNGLFIPIYTYQITTIAATTTSVSAPFAYTLNKGDRISLYIQASANNSTNAEATQIQFSSLQ